MSFVLDTFTATDGTALTAHTGETGATWTQHPNYGSGAAAITGNRLRSDSANVNLFYASGVPGSADYTVSADLKYFSGVGTTGIVGRCDPTASTFYWVLINDTGLGLWSVVAGSFTQIGSATITAADHAIALVMAGTAISVEVDGTPVVSVTDSAVTGAGRAGVLFHVAAMDASSGIHLDNFTATDSGGGDTTPPTLSSAATDAAGTTITATLSESGCTADGGGSSGSGGFTLSGTSATVSSWAISGTTLTLTLSGGVVTGETVTYSYARASTTDDIKDAAGNYLADFSGASVANNVPGLTAGTFAVGTVSDTAVAFTVGVASGGTSPYTYQLQRATSPIGSFADVSGATGTTPSDTSPASGTGHPYFYRSKVTDSAGSPATAYTASWPARAAAALRVGLVGDSITDISGGYVAAPLAAKRGGQTATVENQGRSGSKTADWQAVSSDTTTALAAFTTAGMTAGDLIHVCLGTNDAAAGVGAATYGANLDDIIAWITGAGYVPVVSYPIWINAAGGVSGYDDAANDLIVQYMAEIDTRVGSGACRRGDTYGYEYFGANPGELGSDGIHPNGTGVVSLGGLWANAIDAAAHPPASGSGLVPRANFQLGL